jgi:membrane-associated phospholipid phosphatase
MNWIDIILVVYLLASFPVGVYAFARQKVKWSGLEDMVSKYRWHFMMLGGLFLLKTLIMSFETTVEGSFGYDATGLIHTIEGDAVLAVQTAFLNEAMTIAMGVVYIGSFLFVYVFSILLFSYANKFKTVSQLMFMNLVLLVISIPFYFFLIVYVTSWPLVNEPNATAVVPGMEALLYNYNDQVHGFFVSYDTFNNSFPSMHIGYPAAILILLVRNQPGFKGYKMFLGVIIFLTALSIVYLGIHWLVDILGGIVVAFAAVLLAERYAEPFWKRVYKLVRREWMEEEWH